MPRPSAASVLFDHTEYNNFRRGHDLLPPSYPMSAECLAHYNYDRQHCWDGRAADSEERDREREEAHTHTHTVEIHSVMFNECSRHLTMGQETSLAKQFNTTSARGGDASKTVSSSKARAGLMLVVARKRTTS